MRKAPKIKNGYKKGGKVKGYAEGTPLVAQGTPDDYQFKPDKLGKGNFGEQLSDVGVGALDTLAGFVGAENAVGKPGSALAYKTAGGQKYNTTVDKYVAPIERGVGQGVATYFGGPAAGQAYLAGTQALDKGIEGNQSKKFPGETDQQYAQRMASNGIDIYDNKTGLKGIEGLIGGLANAGVGGYNNLADKASYNATKKAIAFDPNQINADPNEELSAHFAEGGGVEKVIENKEEVKKKPDFFTDGFAGTNISQVPIAKEVAKNMIGYFPSLGQNGEINYYQGTVKANPSDFLKDSMYSSSSNTFPLSTQGSRKLSEEEVQKAYKETPNLFYHGAFPGGIKTEKGKPFVYGKAEGGEIEGPGTAKSDSIKAKVEGGSFVVPAENAHLAEKIRAKYFGNDKKAKLNQKGGTNVKLSDGEHLFTKDEKEFLLKKGVDLEALAPNAEEGNKLAKGTKKAGVRPLTMEEQKEINRQYEEIAPKQYDEIPNEIDRSIDGIDVKASPKRDLSSLFPKATTVAPKTGDYGTNLEKAFGLGQIGYGLTKTLQDKRPVDEIDKSFNESVNEAQGNALYGFDPAAKQSALSNIETARLGMVNLANQTAGADPLRAYAGARIATNDYGKNLVNLAAADAELKLNKERYATGLETQRANMKRTLFNDKMNAFNTNQEAGAALLSSGIENLFGSRRYDRQIESDRENPKVPTLTPEQYQTAWDMYTIKNGK